jgi:hypothetical protein
MDIWMTERIGPGLTDWSTPVNLGPDINTDMDEGAPSISEDNTRLYFHAYNKSISNFDLFYSDRDPILTTWMPREHLGWVINTTDYDDRHPFIFRSDDIIYFDSNRPGGEGDYDIWMTQKIRGHWTAPKPLPNPINTSAYEAAPYVYLSGSVKQLYFESARGGTSQLYVSEWNAITEEWDPPKLMCREFASVLHPYINSTGTEMFFHTVKPGGFGSDDIWVAECLPSPTPTGTWFSPTPTSTSTPKIWVDTTSGKSILAILLFIGAEIFYTRKRFFSSTMESVKQEISQYLQG